jgi:hypothetical protein
MTLGVNFEMITAIIDQTQKLLEKTKRRNYYERYDPGQFEIRFWW